TDPVTATQRKTIEDYLARKYALYVPQVAPPTVSPGGGFFSGTLSVTLTAPTPGSTLHYTLDGSEPTDGSPTYSAPLEIVHSTTLKARAFRPGHVPSAVTTAGFVSDSDFSPRSVGGLALWVASDAGVAADSAGRVSVWRDQSGQGNDLTQ